jgi:hypothetical protein
MSSKELLVAFSCGIWAGLFYLFIFYVVVPSQRALVIVAEDDLSFYDGKNFDKTVFVLAAGESATILRCDYNKKIIEPVIVTKDGGEAYLRSGRMKIQTIQTGLLSRPQFLGCGDH